MRAGTRLGIDVGKARVGVARCDPSGLLATPLETVARDQDGHTDIARIMGLADVWAAVEIVVGLPLNLRGEHTPSTADAVQFAQHLAARGLAVRLVDERLSTVSAMGQLHASGHKAKGSRHLVDQVAAVVILQHALDAERNTGRAPGTLVE